ncbi:MAG: YfiR family protein, partial [Candidatus Aminicenantes bacterium]|nr:YfiR family protein [Candidatus Aminicenantes bacterium]
VIFRSKIKKILDSLKNFPVLTVSEVKVFVHLGGMINFVIVEEEVKFEINKAAADYTGIKIHSSVLSLAIRVIGADHEK